MCMSCGCVLAGTGAPDDDHGDPRNLTTQAIAAAADAAGIALGQAAANIATTLRNVDDGTGPGEPVVKAEGEPQRYVLGVAYQAGPDPKIAKGADGGRDYFTEAELEKAAWKFLQNGPQVGLYHLDGTAGAATVVESYIYRGPDWDLGDGIVVKSGDWLMGAILDDRAWQLYRAGKLNGWSPQGVARRRRHQDSR
jgi:Putative phage serine protease XkdF